MSLWQRNLVERYQLEYADVRVDWRIILRLMFRKWDVRAWNGLKWLRIGRGGGSYLML